MTDNDIKYVEARYHLAAAAESSIICYWLPGDTSYHHEALLTSLAQAAEHLGLQLVPAATETKEAK